MSKPLALFLLALCLSPFTFAQLTETEAKWNEPVKPFRIIGNVHYVGAAEVTSYLITTPKGHILLDAGFPETAEQVKRNVEALGFRLRDIRFIITSQAHYDHVGGVAELKKVSGARLVTSAPDAALMSRGGHDDFGFGDRLTYPPVEADRLVRDGDVLRLGGVELLAHITPGHTRGCITWETKLSDHGKVYDVVFVGSASVPGYKLVDNARYPDIVADYQKTFARLASLRPDVFLGAHGSFFDLQEKIAALKKSSAGNPFIDPKGYEQYVIDARKAFEENLARQRSESAAAR